MCQRLNKDNEMNQWQQLNEKHAALSLREKALILVSSIVIIVFLLANFVIEPQLKSLGKSRKATQSITNDIQETINGRLEIEQKIASDPSGQLQAQLDGFNDKERRVSQALALKNMSLITSGEMARQLQYLVAERKGLTVEKLTSIPPQPILFSQVVEKDEQPKPLLFRHGIEIQIEGRYFEVVNFLQRIEQQNEFLLWGDIEYMVSKYPNALVTFVVATVSPDKEFIGVK